VTFISFIVFF